MSYSVIEATMLLFIILILSLALLFQERSRRILKQQVIRLNNQYRLAEEDRQRMNATFLDIRAERHDFLKHITALHYLLESKQETDATDYLAQLVTNYDNTNVSIKGEQGHIAALLLQTYHLGVSAGVKSTYDIDVPLSHAPLSVVDQSRLIGNLLSNSIEASSEYATKNKEAFINLSTTIRSGLYVIELSNSTLPLPKEIIDSLFHASGQTTKGGDHQGLGTYIISKVVKTYHGKLEYTYLNHTLTIKIKIPIISEDPGLV